MEVERNTRTVVEKRIISILSDVAKNTAVRKAILAHHNCTLEMAKICLSKKIPHQRQLFLKWCGISYLFGVC